MRDEEIKEELAVNVSLGHVLELGDKRKVFYPLLSDAWKEHKRKENHKLLLHLMLFLYKIMF